MFVHNFHISMAQLSLDQSNTSYRVLKNIKSRFFRSSLAELRCVLHRQTLIWGVFWFLGVWECSGMLKTWFQKINLAVVILVIFPQSIFFWSKSRPQRSRFWGSGGISVVSPVRVERVLIREFRVGMLKMFFYQSSLRSDWTLTLGIRVERAGMVRGADLRIEFWLNFSKQTDRSAFLIDVSSFRRKKSRCEPNFSSNRFDPCEI